MSADGKWPREYAADIAKLPTYEQRQAALNNVPMHLKDLTRTHLVNRRSLMLAAHERSHLNEQHHGKTATT